jgi:hypothetical protein
MAVLTYPAGAEQSQIQHIFQFDQGQSGCRWQTDSPAGICLREWKQPGGRNPISSRADRDTGVGGDVNRQHDGQ